MAIDALFHRKNSTCKVCGQKSHEAGDNNRLYGVPICEKCEAIGRHAIFPRDTELDRNKTRWHMKHHGEHRQDSVKQTSAKMRKPLIFGVLLLSIVTVTILVVGFGVGRDNGTDQAQLASKMTARQVIQYANKTFASRVAPPIYSDSSTRLSVYFSTLSAVPDYSFSFSASPVSVPDNSYSDSGRWRLNVQDTTQVEQLNQQTGQWVKASWDTPLVHQYWYTFDEATDALTEEPFQHNPH